MSSDVQSHGHWRSLFYMPYISKNIFTDNSETPKRGKAVPLLDAPLPFCTLLQSFIHFHRKIQEAFFRNAKTGTTFTARNDKAVCASLMSARFMSSDEGLPVEAKAENQICLTNREA